MILVTNGIDFLQYGNINQNRVFKILFGKPMYTKYPKEHMGEGKTNQSSRHKMLVFVKHGITSSMCKNSIRVQQKLFEKIISFAKD